MADKRTAQLPDKSNQLTDMQEAFCQAYVRCFNGAQAAKAAGCKPKNAHVQGSKWLRSPKILKRINNLLDSRQEKEDRGMQKLLNRLWRMSDIEMETYVVKGNLKATAILAKYYGIDINRVEHLGGGQLSEVLVTVVQEIINERESGGLPPLPSQQPDYLDYEGAVDVVEHQGENTEHFDPGDREEGQSEAVQGQKHGDNGDDEDDEQVVREYLEQQADPLRAGRKPAIADLEEIVTLNRATIKPKRKHKAGEPAPGDRLEQLLDELDLEGLKEV